LRSRLPVWSGLPVRPRLRWRKCAFGRGSLRRTPQADAVEHSLSARPADLRALTPEHELRWAVRTNARSSRSEIGSSSTSPVVPIRVGRPRPVAAPLPSSPGCAGYSPPLVGAPSASTSATSTVSSSSITRSTWAFPVPSTSCRAPPSMHSRSRLFGSPEFRSVYGAAYDRVRAEITRQEARLLKPGGILIHSDADGRAQGRR